MNNNNNNYQFESSSHVSPISALLFFIVIIIGIIFSIPFIEKYFLTAIIIWVISLIIAWILSISIRTASQWERVLILRLGKFNRISGPGIFFIIPIIETIPYWIDIRTVAIPIKAEQTLTRDNVPVSVEAILFWRVIEPEHAGLKVENYKNSVMLAAQTALRDVIGKSELSVILSERENIDNILKDVIKRRVTEWGIEVISVEIRDVIIPENLQNAMSQKAQAERERDARVILGDSERIIASSFRKAAEEYKGNPEAMHLRAMNMLFEGLKEKGALMVIPSSALDTMNLGTITGLAALSEDKKILKKDKS